MKVRGFQVARQLAVKLRGEGCMQRGGARRGGAQAFSDARRDGDRDAALRTVHRDDAAVRARGNGMHMPQRAPSSHAWLRTSRSTNVRHRAVRGLRRSRDMPKPLQSGGAIHLAMFPSLLLGVAVCVVGQGGWADLQFRIRREMKERLAHT